MKLSKRQFIVGLSAVAFFAAILYIIVESPLLMRGDIAGIKIGAGWTNYFYLTSSEFTCSDNENLRQVECGTDVEGSPLWVTASYSPAGTFNSCTATYGGKSVACETYYGIFNSTRIGVYINDSLNISPDQMQTIRSQHPLLYWQEANWLNAAIASAVAVTLLLLASYWMQSQRPSSGILKHLALLGASLAFGGLLMYASIVGLLILGYVD